MIEKTKREFIEFLLKTGVLKFGEFTLKSGRKSPYFFNMGLINSGQSLHTLGIYYARAIRSSFGHVDNIFGPAYKGITLAAAAAIGFNLEFNEKVNFCYDRKEKKTHGDKGLVVGAIPGKGERIVIIDDVITTAGTKYEAVELLRSFEGVELCGLVIGMNRKEKNEDGIDAVQKFSDDTGMNVYSIADVHDVIEFLREKANNLSLIDKMDSYLEEYGIK